MRLKQTAMTVTDALLLRGDVDRVFSIAARQAACGGMGALADLIIFQTVLYTGVFGLHGAVNSGFIAAFLIVYFANRYYTFRHIKEFKINSARQMVLYFCASLVSLGLGHIIVRFLVMTLCFIPVIARAVSIVILFFYSLFVTRRLIFAVAD